MRTVLARAMGALRVCRRVSEGWRPALGDAGFGTEARRRTQPRRSSKPTGPGEDQPFPGLLRPENPEELAEVLRAAVVDQQGPLVTLNKPQGLPVTGKPGELTLLSVLPQLSQSLGLQEQELQVLRAPGKEASGLVLLSSCPQTTSRLQKFFTHSRRAQRPTATYCAITSGVPDPPEGTVHTALKLEHADSVVSQGAVGKEGPSVFPSHQELWAVLTGWLVLLSSDRHVASVPWPCFESAGKRGGQVEITAVSSLFFLAGTLGSPSEITIPKGHTGRCQEDPQPLPCDGHRLWLCSGPAAATHNVPWSAAGAHGSTALPSAWGSHLCCSCGYCPGPAFLVGSREHQATETGPG